MRQSRTRAAELASPKTVQKLFRGNNHNMGLSVIDIDKGVSLPFLSWTKFGSVSGRRLPLQQRGQSPTDFILLLRRGYLEKRRLEIRMCDAALNEAVSFGP